MIAASEAPEKIPDVLKVKKRKSASETPKDFSRENLDALNKRRDTLAGTHAQPKRITASDDYVIEVLNDELRLISDSMSEIENGKKYHLTGLANSLRKCIATGNPLPHIQMCAAMKNAPLIVYTEPNPTTEPYDGASEAMSGCSIFPEPGYGHTNPIDLDVWLDQYYGQIKTDSFTHRMAIKKIGDTIGSHFDKDMFPLVVSAKGTISDLGGIKQDLLEMYLKQIAYTVLVLAEKAGLSS